MVKNCAFVFIKPHAVTDKCKEAVSAGLVAKGLEIKKEGSLEAEEIDKKQLIDKHYYAIASKATLLTPDKLNVPKEKFKEQFGKDWDEELKSGSIVNAKDACEKLNKTSDELDAEWAKAKKAKNLVKFGGGFYCGLIECGDKPLYVMNGFFMSMRSKFVAPGTSIYYYVVEWESKDMSWEDFRGKALGPTDPVEAPADSLRGMILKDWKALGLKEVPNVGDNGVHASASPFEALAERVNWLGYKTERDPFGKLLLKAGVSRKQIKDWSVDPQVTYGPVAITKSIFDSLEDTDSDYCLALCQMISGNSAGDKDKDNKVKELEEEVAELSAQLDKYRTITDAIQIIQKYVPTKENGKGEGKGKGKGKGEKEESSGKGKGKGKGKESEGKSGGKSKGKGKGKK